MGADAGAALSPGATSCLCVQLPGSSRGPPGEPSQGLWDWDPGQRDPTSGQVRGTEGTPRLGSDSPSSRCVWLRLGPGRGPGFCGEGEGSAVCAQASKQQGIYIVKEPKEHLCNCLSVILDW